MKDSHIQWTDNTWNPWEGCTKVSPGCAHCYAEARNARFGGGTAPNWGLGVPRRRTSESNWREPVRWNAAEIDRRNQLQIEFKPAGRRPRVFCASLADWLDDEVEISWLADLLILVFDCGFLDWQMLTKRPQNFFLRVKTVVAWIRNHKEPSERNAAIVTWLEDWLAGNPPHNVWIGTTVEDQARANERIPLLFAIPAVVRFLSCEPLLERIDLTKWINARTDVGVVHPWSPRILHWVIVGGESGPKSRATSLDAIEAIVWQCHEGGCPCFVKQLGAKPRIPEGPLHIKHPKGGDPEEWPERFRIQEFPEVGP